MCLLNIYDLSGKMVLEQNITAVTGSNVVEVNATALHPGMYLMRFSGDEINEQLRLSID